MVGCASGFWRAVTPTSPLPAWHGLASPPRDPRARLRAAASHAAELWNDPSTSGRAERLSAMCELPHDAVWLDALIQGQGPVPRLLHQRTVPTWAAPGVLLVTVDDKPKAPPGAAPPKDRPPGGSAGGGQNGNDSDSGGPKRSPNEKSPDYYANVGTAIRTLRDDIPQLFNRDLDYSIYRDDIVFRDPRNAFAGMRNYQTIFWSLRFHGSLFFRRLEVKVHRIWQADESAIRMRWTVRGIPRVPWEAEGTFDGISTYRLDRDGVIYEHAVDNVILRDPPMESNPLLVALNLVPSGVPQQPCPGAWTGGQELAPGTLSHWVPCSCWREASVLQRVTLQGACLRGPSTACNEVPLCWRRHMGGSASSWALAAASLAGEGGAAVLAASHGERGERFTAMLAPVPLHVRGSP